MLVYFPIEDQHNATSLTNDIITHHLEPPPEPAPPEVPPRAQSLLASIKKLSNHTIKTDDTRTMATNGLGDVKHEEFIPQSQQQHGA